MKFVQLFLFTCVSTFTAGFAYGQPSSYMMVQFSDGKNYVASELGRTATTIKGQFVHSGAVYEFDNTGTILKSTGAYRAGTKVKCIATAEPIKSVYSQELIKNDLLGVHSVVFGDGKIYYGGIITTKAGEFSITFHHSGSDYMMHREGSVWKVKSTDKGTYPPGHAIKDIIEHKHIVDYYCP